MDVVIGQLFTGLSIGSILLLAALGLSLTFGQMGVINMAHGEFIMAGSYTAYVVQQVISNATGSLIISLLVGFVVGGLMGVVLEVVLVSRMYHRPLDTLLVTFGVGLILQQLARDIFGRRQSMFQHRRGFRAESIFSARWYRKPASSFWCWRSQR
ncbi:hypothetical protein GCM10020255_060720 [Rhodococcus baikonurensis]